MGVEYIWITLNNIEWLDKNAYQAIGEIFRKIEPQTTKTISNT